MDSLDDQQHTYTFYQSTSILASGLQSSDYITQGLWSMYEIVEIRESNNGWR